MTIRTSTKTVVFVKPFHLAGVDGALPEGRYEVDTDEEFLEGISFPVYRRIRTLIHLPVGSGAPGVRQTLAIDPDNLDMALERDAESAIKTS